MLVTLGFDWSYYLVFQDEKYQIFLFPAVVIGGFFPILLPIILYLLGKIKKSLILKNSAYAVTQAAFLGWLISSIYKTFTGRIQPPFNSQAIIDISHEFKFGFLRHGIFWGWPSSHATVAFAVSVAIFVLYPKKWLVRIFAMTIATYIGIGISVNIHWFSDFAAGAILGSLIGYIVGKTFFIRLKEIINK